MGFGVLILNPAATTQKTIYFCLAGVSLFFALIQTIVTQNGEIRKLKRIAPEIDLKIQDVVMNGMACLVQVSAQLLNMPSASVEYSAQLVFRGEVIELATIKDVHEWEIVEHKYYQQPYPNTPSMFLPKQNFAINPVAITENLSRSVRNEGWLHFQIDGMGETEIAKRTLRLYAISEDGHSQPVDEDMARHHRVASKLIAKKKYLPTPP